jgi:ABC-type glycerol-3-phosphate transport system permease component
VSTLVDSPGRLRSKRSSRKPGQWLIWALLAVGAVGMIFPVYWMLVTALSPASQAQKSTFYLWPSSLEWANFVDVWHTQPVGSWLVNSVIIAVLGVALTVAVSLLAGYAFAKYEFWGRDVLFVALLVTIMVPIQVIMVPEFVLVSKLGLVDSPWAVILPRSAEAIAVFMVRQFMLGVPSELIEAARVDGAGEFRIFMRIVLPLSGPLIGVLVIISFVWRWNDFVWPLIALQGQENYTLPIGLSSMNSLYQSPWESIMAVSLMSLIPTVVIFFLFQRQFVQGVASTGLK